VPGASIYRVEYFLAPPQFPDDPPIVYCATAETSYTPHTLDGIAPAPPLRAIPSGAVAWPQSKTQVCQLQNDVAYYYRVTAYDDSSAEVILADTAPNPPTGSFPEPPNGPSACYQLPECDAGTFTAAGGPFTYKEKAPTGTAGSGSSGGTVSGLKTSWHSSSLAQNACDASTPCPMTPTFSWDPVADSSCYVVTVYRDAGATNTYWKYLTAWTTLTPQDAYLDAQPGRPFYWRVQAARSAEGCSSAAPATCTVTAPSDPATVTPPTITGVSAAPAGPTGAKSVQGGNTSTVTLTGSGFKTGACVESSAGGTSDTTVSATQITFTYSAPVDGGQVTFKVDNPDGGISDGSPSLTVAPSVVATSAIQSFDKRSAAVALRSPRDGATEHGRTLTFDWSDLLATGSKGSYDARNYDLQISRTSGFEAPVQDISDLDLSRYTDPKGSLQPGHYFWRVAAIDESGDILTWTQPREFTLNSNGPTVHFGSKAGQPVGKPVKVNFSELVRGVNKRTLKIVPEGEHVSHALRGKITVGASPRQYVFTPKHPLATGGSYSIFVSPRLVDANDNHVTVVGGPLRTKLLATNHSAGWHYLGGWTRHSASSAFSHSYVEASAGSSATLNVAGDDLQIAGCKGPGMGSISFSVAGKTHTVSEQQSFTRCGVVLWHRALPSGIHTLHVRVQSGHGNFDAVAVT
jgi:hypothetical protein